MTRKIEYAIVTAEGVVEDDLWSLEAAQRALTDYDPDDHASIDLRDNYDANGDLIEDEDDENDEMDD